MNQARFSRSPQPYIGEPTAQHVMTEVLRLQDEVTAMRGEMLTREDVASIIATHMRSAVSMGMQDALNNTLADEERIKRFWEGGYQRLSQHTTNGVSQWVGKRVLLILVAAALSASIGWAVLTGRLR